MFWQSVLGGLAVLIHWEAYIVALEYAVIYIIPVLVAAVWSIRESEEGTDGIGGCVVQLLLPVLQTIAMAIVILTLTPIILNISEDASWGLPWKLLFIAPLTALKMIGLMLLVAMVGAIITPESELYDIIIVSVTGAIAMDVGLKIYYEEYALEVGNVAHCSGVWFCAGILLVVFTLWVLWAVIVYLIVTSMKLGEEMAAALMRPVGQLIGFMPVFMYGAWLGLQS